MRKLALRIVSVVSIIDDWLFRPGLSKPIANNFVSKVVALLIVGRRVVHLRLVGEGQRTCRSFLLDDC